MRAKMIPPHHPPRCHRPSRNLSAIARQAGMSREGLYKALSAGGNPTFATVVKVARALGLRVHFESVA